MFWSVFLLVERFFSRCITLLGFGKPGHPPRARVGTGACIVNLMIRAVLCWQTQIHYRQHWLITRITIYIYLTDEFHKNILWSSLFLCTGMKSTHVRVSHHIAFVSYTHFLSQMYLLLVMVKVSSLDIDIVFHFISLKVCLLCHRTFKHP